MLMKKFLLILFVILMTTFCGCSDETEQIKLVDSVNQIEGMEDYTPANDLAKAFSESVYYEVSNIENHNEQKKMNDRLFIFDYYLERTLSWTLSS